VRSWRERRREAGVRVLVPVAVLLATTVTLLLVVLAARRTALIRARSRRDAEVGRLRPVAAALALDGVSPPPMPAARVDLLAQVLWEFSRQLVGSARDEIGQYFEQTGLVDAMLAQLADRRAWRRAGAAFTLGDTCSARAVPALIAALDDPDRDVRMAATRSLGRLRAGEAAGAIVAAVAGGRVPFALAGAMLTRLGPSAAAPVRTLATAPDPGVRARGVLLLGMLGTAEDAGILETSLADPDPTVAARACVALGRLGTADAPERVRGMLADPDPTVRAAAATALGELGDAPSLEQLLIHARTDRFEPARAAAAAAARISPHATVEAAVAGAAGAPGAVGDIAVLAEAADQVRAAGQIRAGAQ
jgi:HEAT repeat protein